ncbi:MAG: AAA family ATPase, partial [Chroococcales cyanobacterium]
LSRVLTNAALAATVPLLLSAGMLFRGGSCVRQGDQIYLKLEKSDLSPLFVLGGLGAGAIAGWQFWTMAREEKGQTGAIALPGLPPLPNLPPLPGQPQTGLVRGASLSFFKEVFLNRDGSEKAYHASFNGITGDGKTTLCEALIQEMAEGNITYLVNPKHRVSAPEWSFEPVCTNISDALDVLQTLEEMMMSRLSDPTFDEKFTPISYVVIDEIDWICSHHGKKATATIRNLLKVSRSANFRILLCGQSAQLGDSGFNSSDFRQTNRFILGSEAVAFLTNPQMKWSSEAYKDTAKNWQKEGKRFALVVPTKGEPFLQLLPQINREIPDPLYPAPKLGKDEINVTVPNSDEGFDPTRLIELSQRHGWVSGSKAKQIIWAFKNIPVTQVREIFQELESEGIGGTRGVGDSLEWHFNPDSE